MKVGSASSRRDGSVPSPEPLPGYPPTPPTPIHPCPFPATCFTSPLTPLPRRAILSQQRDREGWRPSKGRDRPLLCPQTGPFPAIVAGYRETLESLVLLSFSTRRITFPWSGEIGWRWSPWCLPARSFGWGGFLKRQACGCGPGGRQHSSVWLQSTASWLHRCFGAHMLGAAPEMT